MCAMRALMLSFLDWKALQLSNIQWLPCHSLSSPAGTSSAGWLSSALPALLAQNMCSPDCKKSKPLADYSSFWPRGDMSQVLNSCESLEVGGLV